MPRPSSEVKQRRDRVKLAALISEALSSTGLSMNDAAKKAGISQGHLSEVLKRDKWLGKNKLVKLAGVLGIPADLLMRAAGYGSADIPPITLGEILPLTHVKTFTITIVTDPTFYDSAVFMWMFHNQPFRELGITCNLLSVAWKDVPDEVIRNKNTIAFYNRRAIPKWEEHVANSQVGIWTDLSVYKGYALLARASEKKYLPDDINLKTCNTYLRKLPKRLKKQPVVVCFGGDARWRLSNPLNPIFMTDAYRFSESDPNEALSLFTENRVGELFIGGLPQRIAAKSQGKFIEILTSKQNPLLFSINSMLFSGPQIAEFRPLLWAATALWFETIRKLKTEERFRKIAFDGIEEMLSDKKHNLNRADFNLLFTQRNDYELFPENPSDIPLEYVKILDRLGQILKDGKNRFDLPKVISAIGQTFNPELRKDLLPALK